MRYRPDGKFEPQAELHEKIIESSALDLLVSILKPDSDVLSNWVDGHLETTSDRFQVDLDGDLDLNDFRAVSVANATGVLDLRARADILVAVGAIDTGLAPESPPTRVQGTLNQGDLLVEWGQQWWPAQILQTEGEQHLIHYAGYGPEWNEWVTSARMGTLSGDKTLAPKLITLNLKVRAAP